MHTFNLNSIRIEYFLFFLFFIFTSVIYAQNPTVLNAGPNKTIPCGKSTMLDGYASWGSAPSGYCSVGSSTVRSINWVQFNTISNVSNSNPKAGGNVGPSYENFTSFETTVVPTKTYKLTVWGYVGSNSSNSNAYVTAFFDWNRDGDFYDLGERYDIGVMQDGPSGFNQVVFTDITIPAGASLGKTRMRIHKKVSSYPDQCATPDKGQVEDYTINIGKFSWSPAAGLSATDIPNPIASPTTTTTYTLSTPGGTMSSTMQVNVNSIDVQTGPNQTIVCSDSAQLGGVYYVPLFEENFDAYSDYNLETTSYPWARTNNNGEWDIFAHSGGYYGTSGKGLATFRGSNALTYANGVDNIAYHRFPIVATNYTDIRMRFKWKGDGEYSGGTWNDYGKVVYSLNGTTWFELPAIYGGKNTWQDADVAFPATVNNTNFYIGFKWKSNGSTINAPGFVIDNIMVYAPDNYTYSWTPATNITGINIPNPIVYPKTTTNYYLTMSYTGCVTQTAQVKVTVNPAFTVNAGADVTICNPSSTQLVGSFVKNTTNPLVPTTIWTPSTALSSTNTLTTTASPSSTTNYTLTVSAAGCTNTDNVTVNVANPDGNPTIFGQNKWNVYAYNAPVASYTPSTTGMQYLNLNSSVVRYAGWYVDNTFNINTQTVWNLSLSPDQAPGYQGCPVANDNHVFVYKRRGFPCGTYKIGSFTHDDAVRIIVDGVVVYETTTCCASNPNLTLLLGGNSEVEIRVGENTGASYLAIDFTPAEQSLAQNNDTRTCYVAANSGWNTFSTNGGRTLVSINPGASELGNVVATAFVDASPLLVDACLPIYNMQTAVLGRRWTITPTNQPTNNVRVRLYIGNSEHASLVPVSNASSNPDDQTSVYSDLKLSKYHHPTNVAVNGSFNDNCANIGPGSMSIWSASSFGNASSIFTGFDANGRYLEYELTSPGTFSEFWLHGSQTSSPLAITMAQFSSICESNGINVNWTTASEKNVSHFEVYKSRDGINWNLVKTIDAVGDSQQLNDYSFIDEKNTGSETYYKMRVVDFDGTSDMYGPIVVNCASDIKEWSVFPIPANTEATVAISTNTNSVETIGFFDMNGKLILSEEIQLHKGVNTINVNVSSLARGTYFVNILRNDEYKPIKFIKM